MTKIEIVNDAGDEFSVTDLPIPFYVRCKLEEEGLVRYRVRLLDELGNSRGYYIGATDRDYLELHVPVIPLREYGKLIVEIELKDEDFNEIGTHETSIEYVDQETYNSIVETQKKQEIKPVEGITAFPTEDPVKQVIPEIDSNSVLTANELDYLTQRADILGEGPSGEENTTIKELSEIRKEEEE